MATLASRSKQLSGLSSGTLAQHLAAISLGTGERLVSQMTVCMNEPRMTVAAKRKAASVDQRSTAPTSDKVGGRKHLYASAGQSRLDVVLGSSAVYVTQRTHALPVTVSLDRLTISTQHK